MVLKKITLKIICKSGEEDRFLPEHPVFSLMKVGKTFNCQAVLKIELKEVLRLSFEKVIFD